MLPSCRLLSGQLEVDLASGNPFPVTRLRRHRQRQGFNSVEGQVRKDGAAPVVYVAAALVEPEQASETRGILHEKIAAR